ncbi:MAG: alpha/beta hydrolase, partial [Micrococcales bacterium]|nr:alpha/beta hydrolase [Micrococcales bacterium]
AAQRWALMTDDPHLKATDLAGVDIPVLVVVGGRDVIRPEHTRLIATSLPHASLTVVPGAGHALPATHPVRLARLATDFLA